MIAGNIDYSSSFLGEAQYLTNHIGMTLIPSPTVLLYLPTIYDVTDKIERVARVVFQEVEKMEGLTVPRSKMNVRYEDGSVVHYALREICERKTHSKNGKERSKEI